MSSYYIIIPSRVRYDSRLTPSEKLLYGEILALSEKSGYCFATNSYFAKLYNVTVVSVSNWVGHLIDYGYISAEYNKTSEDKSNRKLYVLDRSILDNEFDFEEIIEDKAPVKEDNYTKNKKLDDSVSEVINYLNTVCKTKFRSNTAATKRMIKARFNEGFDLQDFKKVIEWKYKQWGERPFRFSGGQLSSDYLRPATLFSNKFESYLYEANNNKVTTSESNIIQSVPIDEDRSGIFFT